MGAPLWGEFNGEVENLAPNFSPPNYRRAAVGGGLDARARALPKVISPATWAIKFGRKKLFYENFFLPKTGGPMRGGGKFSGITGGRSYTVPTAFGQGGIETLRLSFAAGSPGNWGFHGPPNWVKLWTLQMPQKIQGVVGESFPLEGILSPRVRHG